MRTKTCSICKHEFEASTEFFYASKRGKNGLHNRCKSCQKKISEDARKRRREEHQEKSFKACTSCGGVFQATRDFFYKDLSSIDGLTKQCRECFKLSETRARLNILGMYVPVVRMNINHGLPILSPECWRFVKCAR